MASKEPKDKESIPKWLKTLLMEISTSGTLLKEACLSIQQTKLDSSHRTLAARSKKPPSHVYTASLVRECHRLIAEHVQAIVTIDNDIRLEFAAELPEEAKHFIYPKLPDSLTPIDKKESSKVVPVEKSTTLPSAEINKSPKDVTRDAVLEDVGNESDISTTSTSSEELEKRVMKTPRRKLRNGKLTLFPLPSKDDKKLLSRATVYVEALDGVIMDELEACNFVKLDLQNPNPRDKLTVALQRSAYSGRLFSELEKKRRYFIGPMPKSKKDELEEQMFIEEVGRYGLVIGNVGPTEESMKTTEESSDCDDVGASSENEETKAKAAVIGDSTSSPEKAKVVVKQESTGKPILRKGSKSYTPAVESSDDSDDSVARDNKKTKSTKVKDEAPASDGSSSDVGYKTRNKRSLRKTKQKGSGNSQSPKSASASDSSDGVDHKKRRKTRNKKRTKSASSESYGESDEKPKRKVRRRIRASSSEDGSEEDNAGKEVEKGKRKNIRKVIGDKNVDKSTRQAGLDEEERKKRVLEKQRMFNEHFQLPTTATEELKQLVLDFDPKTKEPILSVDPEIVSKLKPHQADGIRFMWNACFESVSKAGPGDGCILAHCMGLGKTLQTIAFLHTVLTNKKLLKLRSALVICPLSTVGNWFNEFKNWLKDVDTRVNLHRLWEHKPHERTNALADWKRLGGVGIIHYDAFRLLVNSEDRKGKKKIKPKELAIIRETLINPGPDIVICDEGHLLKNPQSQQSKSVNKINTRRRVVLTGTPLQNNLLEYHTMMQFVKPSLLGSRKEFSNRFVNPILNGQHKDSGEADVKVMKRRAHVLHKLLDGCVQRLDYSVLTPFLPPKLEYALAINMSDVQKKLYQFYIENLAGNTRGEKFKTSRLFSDYQVLVKVWTHPKVLTFKTKSKENDDSDSENSLKDFIVDKSTTEEEMTTESSSHSDNSGGSDSDWASNERKKKKLKRGAKKKTKDEEVEAPEVEKVEMMDVDVGEGDSESKQDLGRNWYKSFLDALEDPNALEHSGKLLVLMEILQTCESIGDKVLIFSQFLTSLDLIEDLLAEIDDETVKSSKASGVSFPRLKGQPEIGRWRPGIEYFRLDGSTKSETRQQSCDNFNQESASMAKLFLISTRAGGLGINLVGANRVIIFDASWNPSHDLQSIFRVFRFGQTKPCYVYRLLARGTMEEKIYNRQVVKLSLSCRVVDEQQIERHFHFDEIQQMYHYDANDTKERPTPIVPKDRLLADLLISQKDRIFSYLEHDSLLENKEEEELTELERKAAWEEYNNINEAKQNVQSYGYNPLQDKWIIQTARHFLSLYPGRTEQHYLTMAQEAKFEVQAMVKFWDLIHSDKVNDMFKMEYRFKFDDVFLKLSSKFGQTANWDTVLRKYPEQLNRAHPYLYTRPTAISDTQARYASLLAQTMGLGPGNAGAMNLNSNMSMIANSMMNPRPGTSASIAQGTSMPMSRPYGGIVPSTSIFEDSSTPMEPRSKPSILKTNPTAYIPPKPAEVISLDN